MSPTPPAPRRCTPIVIALAVALVLASAGAALGASGGGGVGIPDPPTVRDAICIDRCAGLRKAAAGSKIQLSGSGLGETSKLSFARDGGSRIRTDPRRVTAKQVIAKVPAHAATGKVRASGPTGGASSPTAIKIVPAGSIPDDDFRLRSAVAAPHKAYFDGKRPAGIVYRFRSSRSQDVRIDVVNRHSGKLVRSLTRRDQPPFTDDRAGWDGKTATGKPAPAGRYEFRVGPLRGGAVKSTDEARFGLYGNIFPVRAKHSYGDGFGAGRGHQGQDVFARCGSKLVAARGGRVTFNKFQSRAGNYLVIDAKGSNHDYMYAHLKLRSPVAQGKRVKTGQVIGRVGQTGDATGCHLHFEYWTAPWQQGGQALPSVSRVLRRWDGWS